MGKINSRQKGAAGERELANWLKQYEGVEARRGQQFSGSPDSPDVVHSMEGLHIECKQVEALSLRESHRFHVGAVQQHDAASRFDAAITVAVPVDRGVELVVAAHRHQEQLPLGPLDLG